MNKLISHLKQNPAPFYLVQFPFYKEVNHLLFWQELMKTFIPQNMSNPLEHPDILWLSTEDGKYSPADLEKFQRFLLLTPHELTRKYVIWEDGGALSVSLVNKLLKDLEDPGQQVCILMGQKKRTKLLSTLTSRALLVRISLQEKFFLGESYGPETKEILERFKKKELTALSFAQNNLAKKEIASELWTYVLKNRHAKEHNGQSLKRLQESQESFLKGQAWNHLRKDHLLELGKLVESCLVN